MNPIFTIEKAPRPITKTLSSEILSLWESENAGISNLDERLAEIRYVARSEEGDLAGVCSCTVDQGIFNGLHFHAMRVLVASAFRQKLLAFELLAYLVEELSDNRHGKFKIGPVGVKVVIQNPIVAERGSSRGDYSGREQGPVLSPLVIALVR